MTVSGIGTKLELAVFERMESSAVVTAIRQGDLPRLTRTPGIGRKTAERLVVELKDRMPEGIGDAPGTFAEAPGTLRGDLLSALENLGYARHTIEKPVDAVLRRGESDDFEAVLRQILRELSRP